MKNFTQSPVSKPASGGGGMKDMMQEDLNNNVASDKMQDWQQPPNNTMQTGAATNHGFPVGGNGVGGMASTHENHHALVPHVDDCFIASPDGV